MYLRMRFTNQTTYNKTIYIKAAYDSYTTELTTYLCDLSEFPGSWNVLDRLSNRGGCNLILLSSIPFIHLIDI